MFPEFAPGCLPVSLAYVHRVDVDPIAEPALAVGDGYVIAAHHALAHAAVLGKGPVLKPIAPVPLLLLGLGLAVRCLVLDKVLVPELHRDAVLGERKQLLAQPVAVLLGPLGLEKVDNGCVALQERVAVAPDAVVGVGRGDDGGIPSTMFSLVEEEKGTDTVISKRSGLLTLCSRRPEQL